MSLVIMGGCGGGDDPVIPEDSTENADAAARELVTEVQKLMVSLDFDGAETKLKEAEALDGVSDEVGILIENARTALDQARKVKLPDLTLPG